MPELWLLVLAGAAVTYVWRGFGVLLSGRVKVDGELFNWIACVAYAMVAGLIARIVVLPTGILADSLLAHRLAACAVGLIAFHLFRRSLFAGVGAGTVTVIALGYLPVVLA